MTETLTRPMTQASKPPARETLCKRFWRHLLYSMAQQSLDQFMEGAMWNRQAREAYLQAIRGDRHEMQVEASIREDNQ